MPGRQSNGLQQVALDTLWYIDPESGLDGVWDNSLAADKPHLQRRLHRNDGEAAQGHLLERRRRVHCRRCRLDGRQLRSRIRACASARCWRSTWHPLTTPDPYTVVFKLKKPNSRFHANFTVRWDAIWIMPKHVFEKVEDPLKFDFNKPVSLGAYVLHSYDPDGKWYIWQLRDDWQRTTLGRYGKPGPKYLAYIDPGPPDKRVIAQLNHELDVDPRHRAGGHVHAGQARQDDAGWFKGFPYGHPDPTLPAVIFNTQNDLFKNPRRALGAGAADRHQGGVDGVLSRRRDHLGDRRSADRHPSGNVSSRRWKSGSTTSSSTPASARSSRTIPRSASRSPTCCGLPWANRSRPIPKRSPSRSAWAGGRPIRRPRRNCWRRPASPNEAAPGSRRTASPSAFASWSKATSAR